MSSTPTTHVIQVTNVAPAATLEQMKELFGFLGRIKNIKLYPENYIVEPQSRVCYVQYHEKWSVGVAQHLTNTVFIDRALIVVPIADEGIPSESTALALTNPTSALPGLVSSGPNALINEICGVDGCLVITTTDPKLTALGLPQYPPLPANLDPVRIEEIRRTVTIGNLDASASAENLLKFVNQIGEVKFLKMCGDGIQTNKFAFAEFTDQSSVPKALQYNGVAFEGRPMIIAHSTNAIVKPLPKNSETAQKDIDEAMKRVREAQSLITAAIEPELSDKDRRKSHRSRSRSRSRRRSTSRSRHKRKSRSRSRSKRSRSRRRSRTRRQSRSPPRHSKPKSRSRSRERKKVLSPRHKKERTRSRSRERKKDVPSSRYRKERSRSRSPSRSGKKEISSRNLKKERSRSHSRDRSNKRKSKSQSPSKINSKYRKSKISKEKEIKTRELERSPRSPKSPKESKAEVKESSNELKSRSNYQKGNSQPKELYGPFLPVPETNSSVKEDSKSSYRSNKHPPSRSRSRSPIAVKRNKYRTRSRSLSKESTYSHKNSRSVSKHRSRSRSHKRSRSRSKVPSRKMNSPSRNRRIRDRSRSRSYSPGRQFDRRRKSPKRHSISSRKRSITPKRTSRRRSITPRQRSRSPKHRSRSRSYRRSRSPQRLRTKKSPPRSDRDISRSPKRHSSSLSPTNNRCGQRKISDSKEKTPKSSPSFQIDGAKMNCKVTRNYDEEDYNLEKMIQDSNNEKTEFIPFLMENNYNSGYNSVDMDLASD